LFQKTYLSSSEE